MSVSAVYLEATVNTAAVARHHAVEAFVNMSQMTVTQMSITETTESPEHKLHWLVEQALSWSGLPVVRVPPTVFLEGFFLLAAATARDADELALPMGAGKTSPVSSVDVARAVAAILDDPAPHIGHLNDLTGPKSADLDHYARVFSEALGRTIRYRHAPTSNWSEKLRAAGLSEHVVDHLTVMTELHKQGRYDRSSEDYLKPTGEKPTSMADFAEPHAAEFTRPSRFCAGPSGFDAEIEVQRAADRLHPDKGCGSLPARRYDLLPDRSRSAGPSYRPERPLVIEDSPSKSAERDRAKKARNEKKVQRQQERAATRTTTAPPNRPRRTSRAKADRRPPVSDSRRRPLMSRHRGRHRACCALALARDEMVCSTSLRVSD
jgi:hypothetical protein